MTVQFVAELFNPLRSLFMGRMKPEGAKAACSITEYYNEVYPVGYGLFCLIQLHAGERRKRASIRVSCVCRGWGGVSGFSVGGPKARFV